LFSPEIPLYKIRHHAGKVLPQLVPIYAVLHLSNSSIYSRFGAEYSLFGESDKVVFVKKMGVANSEALRLSGITRNTPDPEGGRIHRDPATGEPTGQSFGDSENITVDEALRAYTTVGAYAGCTVSKSTLDNVCVIQIVI
jgi:hypothetical protein